MNEYRLYVRRVGEHVAIGFSDELSVTEYAGVKLYTVYANNRTDAMKQVVQMVRRNKAA